MSKRNDDGLGFLLAIFVVAAFIMPVIATGAHDPEADRSSLRDKLLVRLASILLIAATVCAWVLVWPIWLSVVLTVLSCFSLIAVAFQIAINWF